MGSPARAARLAKPGVIEPKTGWAAQPGQRMMRRSVLTFSAMDWSMSPLLFAPLLLVQAPPLQGPQVSLTVDSARHVVLLQVSPLCTSSQEMAAHSRQHHSSSAHREAWLQFRWPVDGWVRGFRANFRDGASRLLPRSRIHHLILADLERRQLVHPAIERLFAIGQETEDVILPKTIGVPLKRGTRLAIKGACAPSSSTTPVSLSLELLWTPANQFPRPVSVLPFYVDVHLKSVLDTNTFDLPAGRSTTGYDFSIPVGGWLLAVGGHLHDYGVAVQLEDVSSRRVISRLQASRSPTGKVLSVERKLYGITGPGHKLKAGTTYRLVAIFDNPTGAVIEDGGMAHLVGLFEPEDLRRWPPISSSDADLQEDLRRLSGNE
jgi:hypothetical protein